MVLGVSWGPGEGAGSHSLDGRVLGTGGSRGTLKKYLFFEIKYQ